MGGKQDKENVKSEISSVKERESGRKNRFKLKKPFSRNNSPSEVVAKSASAVATSNSTNSTPNYADTVNRANKFHTLRYPELFENEAESDVTFLVGIEPTIWRLPAHKFILVAANPVFAAMFKGPLSSKDNKEEVPIEDLDPKAFENMLRFVYTNEIKLTSIDLTLATLFAAEKYMITELIHLCLQNLEANVASTNVLSIYPRIRFLALSRQQQITDFCTIIVEKNIYIPLLNRCLEHIDAHADHIFSLEDIEELSEAELSDIVFRDSLQLKSELNVFRALQMWATQQCKFKQKEITSENKRRVLGSALYAVRYILMSKEDFRAGPYVSDLLNKEEKLWFLKRIEGHSECDPPHHIADRQRYLERKRGASGHQISSTDSNKNISIEKENENPYESFTTKRCCRVTKIFTEVFLCFSLFFD